MCGSENVALVVVGRAAVGAAVACARGLRCLSGLSDFVCRACCVSVCRTVGNRLYEGAFGSRSGGFMACPAHPEWVDCGHVSPMAHQERASGSSDGCNVLQHSWLTTHNHAHNLARERGRL